MPEAAHSEAQMQAKLAEARKTLMKLHGVTGVGFGYREQGGQPRLRLGWRVYVQEKVPLESIPPEERIPSEFAGFPTDVVKMGQSIPQLECEDSTSYDPLLCGAFISNLIVDDKGMVETGTLGFFATYNDEQDPAKNVVLVTCHHVLVGKGGTQGDDIYQPWRVPTATGEASIHKTLGHPHERIAKTLVLGLTGLAEYNDGSGDQNYFVDAGAARLNLGISSGCGIQCGVKFRQELRPPGILGSTEIAGHTHVTMADLLAHPLTDPYLVYKVGARTGVTEGWLMDVAATVNVEGQHYGNAMLIIANSKNCRDEMVFSDQGDSGSILMNKHRMIVGILQGGNADRTKSYGCHIHPVLGMLNVTPISAANPHMYASTRTDGPAMIVGDRIGGLRNSPQSTTLHRLFAQHRAELTDLVNHCRPVTVAWHRHQGPGFTNRIIANSRNPEVLIPEAIEGTTLRQLGEAMYPLILAHGSPALRSAVEAHAATLLPLAEGLRSLHTLVSSLNPAEHE